MALYNGLLFLHLLGVTVWVGGMFLMHMVVRPSAAELLAPPQRLPFLSLVLGRFFNWVGLAILLILLSGLGILHQMRAWDEMSPAIYAMTTIGLLMMGLFGHIRFASYPRLRSAVEGTDWAAAGAALSRIRHLVAVNLVLGLLTIGLATLGRLLG